MKLNFNYSKRKSWPFSIKAIALTLVMSLVFQLLEPTLSYALTSGPSQPESETFQPVGVTDMVDLFSGDFGYNIPLLELPGPNGGYPFNLSYQSGITMDQEASWVGLGWNINAGSIVRNMRGIPDEFKGDNDQITRTLDMKSDYTYGGKVNLGIEFAGANPDVGVSVSLGVNIYDNSYRGVGYGIDLGTSFSTRSKSKMNGGMGFNFSMDSQEGFGANIDMSLSSMVDNKNKNNNKLGLGVGFNSTGGFYGTMTGRVAKSTPFTHTNEKTNKITSGTYSKGPSASSSISFAYPSHTPSINIEMTSNHFTGSLTLGGGSQSIYGYGGISGYFSKSVISKNVESFPTYGYLNYQFKNLSSNDHEHAMLDFNREKDGVVYRESKNLASPNLTYDYYIINGQGTGGMFRPFRQEYGHVHEQSRRSTGMGGSFGLDIGIPTTAPGHIGINGSFNYSRGKTGDWSGDGNDAQPYFDFKGKGPKPGLSRSDAAVYQGVYFKMLGDMAAIPMDELDAIGEVNAVELVNDKHKLKNQLKSDQGFSQTLNHNMMGRAKRMPRATNIIHYTNTEIMERLPQFNEVLREYDIKVYKTPNANTNINANNLSLVDYSSLPNSRGKVVNDAGTKKLPKGNHLAGITVQQADGKRYVYALPAYNNKQVQEVFTVPYQNQGSSVINASSSAYGASDKTDMYHERTEMPRYAHSYLLTAVLGDDYVDADDIPGPSEKDYGYWVKFNYIKTTDAYKWRTPFAGADYNPGLAGSSADDKGSFTYGEKEIWYMASAETQTHIVYFEMSPRKDALGASEENNNNPASPGVDSQNKLYKLDKIKLYSKADLANQKTEPIQTVHFVYDYSLCQQSPNSTTASKGKLTLKSVYFTFKNDRSGALSPYRFHYDEDDFNPDYDFIHNTYDRWGNYRTSNYGSDRANEEFPYRKQFDPAQTQSQANRDAFKEQVDKDVSAWHLKKIELPSGGTIHVEYESDDYAYVQHKKATQMFKIESIRDAPESAGNDLFKGTDHIWGQQYDDDDETDTDNSETARMIHFKLEYPVPTGELLTEDAQKTFITNNYLECLLDKEKKSFTKPFFAKFKSKLRGNIEDYIAGYFKVQLDDDGRPLCGVSGNQQVIDGVESYVYGYLVVDFAMIDDKPVHYHPFAVSAWQFMRINLPRILTATGEFEENFEVGNDEIEHLTRIGSLGSWANSMSQIFKGYRKYCYSKEFARQIDLSESFIRLSTPDGVKYGGGSRVKKLYVENDPVWGDDKMGQVYDYTLKQNGNIISSGVASYEPMIGGEENVLRTAKMYTQNIPTFTDNNLFFELPVNESYYPAPRVGYSMVTISSLNTADVESKIASSAASNEYEGILTTGKTIHQFYTARDFPVMAYETDLSPHGKPYIIPLPFIGNIQISKLTASQGYSIELNDMHGKPKKVEIFASKKGGGFSEEPVSSVAYYYKTVNAVYEGEPVLKLDNAVDVLIDDQQMKATSYGTSGGFDKAQTEKMLIGLDYDFFADFRHAVDEAGTGGLSFNLDWFDGGVIKVPLPFPWPSFNFSHTSTRLAVTNKIIHRAGIMDRVVATDGQSTVTTQNLVFDKYTGAPLLTTVNNNYDNKIYNYEYPAHLAYHGTGSAYDNILMEFTGRMMPPKNYTGTGFTLQKEDLTANPIQRSIGNNPYMGEAVNEIADATNIILFNELYNLLNEGDEFIVEFLKYNNAVPDNVFYEPGDGKTIAILKEKRMGVSYTDCTDEPILIFDFPYETNLTYRIGTPVRMLLVRSGKRNLLDMKVGAIKTLLPEPVTEAAALLANSPLQKREKVYTAGTTDPALYEKLTREVTGFLNTILDCNGQLPVGQYFFDDPRFLANDGSLRYPALYGMLKSIRVDNNCGMPTYCEKTEPVGEPQWVEAQWQYNCVCYEPGPDMYSPSTCNGPLPFPSNPIEASKVWAISYGIFNGGCSSEDYTCIQNYYNNNSFFGKCWKLNWVPAHYYQPVECVQYSCNNCSRELARDLNDKPINDGYHLVLNFRDEFKPGGQSCYTAHCSGLARFKGSATGAIQSTRITAIEYQSPGIISFDYQPFNRFLNGSLTSVTSTQFCFRDLEFSEPQTSYKIADVLAASAIELTPYKLNEDQYKYICNSALLTYANWPFEAHPNLYATGYKGIWRPSKTYYYNDERYQANKTSLSDNMTSMQNLSVDGIFDGESNDRKFFLFNWNPYLAKKIHKKWLANETVTKFTRNSQSAEARDVLGIYSSVLFDKNDRLPVAVGRGMRTNEMVYENFDNTEVIAWSATDDLEGNGTKDLEQVELLNVSFTGARALSTKSTTRYVFSKKQFSPVENKKYIISAWAGGFNTLYSPVEVDQRFSHLMNLRLYFMKADGSTISATLFKPKGKIFEGNGTFWRKIEQEFTVPPLTDYVIIEFGTTGYSDDSANQLYGTMFLMVGNGNIFIDQRALFDDIRIYPADGLMNTYVYNESDYRLMAEGDENNFPTLYGYAPSGALMVVKKLTEEGIKTLKEIRSNTKRKPGLVPESDDPVE